MLEVKQIKRYVTETVTAKCLVVDQPAPSGNSEHRMSPLIVDCSEDLTWLDMEAEPIYLLREEDCGY